MAEATDWFSDLSLAGSPPGGHGDLHPESGHSFVRSPDASCLTCCTLGPQVCMVWPDHSPADHLPLHWPQDLGTCCPFCLEPPSFIPGSCTANTISLSQGPLPEAALITPPHTQCSPPGAVFLHSFSFPTGMEPQEAGPSVSRCLE